MASVDDLPEDQVDSGGRYPRNIDLSISDNGLGAAHS